MKNLLLSIGLSISLIFCGGNYIHAQETTKKTNLEVPESVRKYGKKLEHLSLGEHVLVKLASDIDVYMVSSINGAHVNILAEKLKIHPIMPNNKYSCYRIAFHSNNLKLKQIAKELDKNDDKIISLDELGEIY